jgi:hypothetical protein
MSSRRGSRAVSLTIPPLKRSQTLFLAADIENSDQPSLEELHQGRIDEGGLEESWSR